MYLTKKQQKELVVKKALHGKGVFVLRQFELGKIITQIVGTFMKCDVDDDIDEETRSNTFRFSNDWYISPKGKIGHYVNHSCDPNVKVVKKDDKLFLVACKLIKKGDEIVFDYSTIIAPDDCWEMQCGCRSAKCRGVIKSFDTLPKKTREFYVKNTMVPKQILKLL